MAFVSWRIKIKNNWGEQLITKPTKRFPVFLLRKEIFLNSSLSLFGTRLYPKMVFIS